MRSTPALAVLIALSAAAPAHAAFTASTLETPPNGARYLATDAVAPVVTVKGDTNGPNGDTVNAYCWRKPTAGGLYVGQVVTGAGGAFTIGGNVPGVGTACMLRAVPNVIGPDLSPFEGRWVIFERQHNKLTGGGLPYDFEDFVQSDQGGTTVRSLGVVLGGGGLTATRLTDMPGQRNSEDAFFYAGGILHGDLSVDGRRAFTPSQANVVAVAGAPGQPAVAVTRTREGTAGNATVSEADPLAFCPGDPPNPDPGACPSFTSAGVRWDRQTRTSENGTRYEQLDTLTSTDGAAHTVAAWIDYSAKVDGNTPAFGLSWVDGGARSVRAAGTTLAGPPGGAPATLLLDRNSAAADGDFAWPHTAITWDRGPVAVSFGANKNTAARFEDLAVPAGGSIMLRTRYVIGQTAAGVADVAAGQRDLQAAPAVAFSAPADGATFFTPSVTLSGKASDTEGLASLVVAGRAVTPAADGSFSLTLPLALGANRFEATATDHAGQTATAALTVTYVDNVAPSLTAFGVSPAKFRVGKGATAIAAATRRKRAPVGTTIRYTLGEAAPVTLVLTRVESGRRSRGRCVKPTRKLRRAKKCERLTVVGTLRRNGVAGVNKVAFSGRVGTKALKPASYRVSASARDAAGNASRVQTAAFKIVTR